MICYVLAMGKQHLGPHVVVGYGIKIFWPGLFITSPDHLVESKIEQTTKTTPPWPRNNNSCCDVDKESYKLTRAATLPLFHLTLMDNR